MKVNVKIQMHMLKRPFFIYYFNVLIFFNDVFIYISISSLRESSEVGNTYCALSETLSRKILFFKKYDISKITGSVEQSDKINKEVTSNNETEIEIFYVLGLSHSQSATQS